VRTAGASKTLGNALSFSATLSSGDLLASTSSRLSIRGSQLAAALLGRTCQPQNSEECSTVTLQDGVPVALSGTEPHSSLASKYDEKDDGEFQEDEEEEVVEVTDVNDLDLGLGLESASKPVLGLESHSPSPSNHPSGSYKKLLSVLTTDDDGLDTSSSVLWRASPTWTDESPTPSSSGGSLRNLFSFRPHATTLERRKRRQQTKGNSGRSLVGMGDSGRSLMSAEESVRSLSPTPRHGVYSEEVVSHSHDGGRANESRGSAGSKKATMLARSRFARKSGKGQASMKRKKSRKNLKRNAKDQQQQQQQEQQVRSSGHHEARGRPTTRSTKSTGSSSSSSSSHKSRVFLKSVDSEVRGRPTMRSTKSTGSLSSSSSSKSRVFLKSVDSSTEHPGVYSQSPSHRLESRGTFPPKVLISPAGSNNVDVASSSHMGLTPWEGFNLTDADVVGMLGKSFNRMLSREDVYLAAYAPKRVSVESKSEAEVDKRRSSSGSIVPDAYVGSDMDWDSRLLAVRELRMQRTLRREVAALSRSTAGSMDV
jgi:hypothetical protein